MVVDEVISEWLTLLEAEVGHLADGWAAALHVAVELIQEHLLLRVGETALFTLHLLTAHHILLQDT